MFRNNTLFSPSNYDKLQFTIVIVICDMYCVFDGNNHCTLCYNYFLNGFEGVYVNTEIIL